MKPRPTHPSTLRWSLVALALIGVSLASQSIFAGSVTNPGGSPVTKLAVYQGVLSIAPGRDTNNVLEFGNNGSDIASTGNIYFRPGRLAETNSVRFAGTSGKTDIYIPGRLCINGACVPPWPSGSGTSLWQQNGVQLETINTPSTQPRGVEILNPNASLVEGGSALEAVGNKNGTSVVYISNTSGPALQLNAGGYIRGDLSLTTSNITSPITVNYTFNGVPGVGKVWYPGNDGAGSGLDADMLDSQLLHFSFYDPATHTAIGGTCGGGSNCGGNGTIARQWLCTNKYNVDIPSDGIGPYSCLPLY